MVIASSKTGSKSCRTKILRSLRLMKIAIGVFLIGAALAVSAGFASGISGAAITGAAGVVPVTAGASAFGSEGGAAGVLAAAAGASVFGASGLAAASDLAASEPVSDFTGSAAGV